MLFSLLFSALAFAAVEQSQPVGLRCNYQIYSAPFASLEFYQKADGGFDSSVVVDHQGQRHKESLTEVTPGDGELLHAWISKESEKNSLEVIIYLAQRPEGRSLLINPHLQFGNKMWGNCTWISGER